MYMTHALSLTRFCPQFCHFSRCQLHPAHLSFPFLFHFKVTYFYFTNTRLPILLPTSSLILFQYSFLKFLYPLFRFITLTHISLLSHIESRQWILTPLYAPPHFFISLMHSPPNAVFNPWIPSLEHLLFLIYLLILSGEGHFQICVHELWPLPGHAAGPESQWLLHMGRGKPKA